ncbi:MAG: cupin domain-containing protein [Devosia sp.]|nr:cupin domain-containing protein [Devosia sp.]
METLIRQFDELPVGFGEGALFSGRAERRLAKAVGVTQFGVNHVTLAPGARTASRHWHEAEDEFVFVVSGKPILVDENGRHSLAAGTMVGFPAGIGNAHHILNESNEVVVLFVVGSRRPGAETIHYPDDDFGPIRK